VVSFYILTIISVIHLVLELREIFLVGNYFLKVLSIIVIRGSFLRVNDSQLVEILLKVICAHNPIFANASC